MKYYTLEEVAAKLKVSPEQVFKMTMEQSEHYLWPAARLEHPVKLKKIESIDTC